MERLHSPLRSPPENGRQGEEVRGEDGKGGKIFHLFRFILPISLWKRDESFVYIYIYMYVIKIDKRKSLITGRKARWEIKMHGIARGGNDR